MPTLDAGIFFGGGKEDDRIKFGHDESYQVVGSLGTFAFTSVSA